MANDKNQPKKTKRSSATKSRSQKKPTRKAASKAKVDGIAELCQSVNREVAAKSEAIAKKLVQRVEEGSVTGAKLLVELMEKDTPQDVSRSTSGSKYVGMLADEPEQLEPASEGKTPVERITS